MKQPKVSICVPAYNAEATIRQSIESIVSQTYKNLDIVVVDDCSTDRTLKISQSFKDPRLRIIRHEVNKGAGDNWDFCIHAGRGAYTCLFHADDFYEPELVEHQVAFLNSHPEAGAIFTMAFSLSRNGDVFVRKMPPQFTNPDNWDRTYEFMEIFKPMLEYYNFLISANVMVRTEIYQNHVKTYNHKRFGVSGDLWMWLRILEKYKIGVLPKPLMTWRESLTQWSSRDKYLITTHHPFFDVIYYYMSQNWVKTQLNQEDYRNLSLLEMVDRYTRAINCVIQGKRSEALSLTKTAWNLELLWKIISYSPHWKPSRYYKWWIAGILVNSIAIMPEVLWPKKRLFQYMYGKVRKSDKTIQKREIDVGANISNTISN